MAINKLTTDLNIIAALSDEPNETDGLTAAQLKAKFDLGSITIQTYINGLIDILSATTAGSSGAEQIGSAAINGVAGDTVYEQLVAMKGVINAMAMGAIPDASIGASKLSFTALTSTDKTELQGSINTNSTNIANNTTAIGTNLHRMYMGV